MCTSQINSKIILFLSFLQSASICLNLVNWLWFCIQFIKGNQYLIKVLLHFDVCFWMFHILGSHKLVIARILFIARWNNWRWINLSMTMWHTQKLVFYGVFNYPYTKTKFVTFQQWLQNPSCYRIAEVLNQSVQSLWKGAS